MTSGYHNIFIVKEQWRLLGIAPHASELPAEAIEFLRTTFHDSEDPATGNFYFLTVGLGPVVRSVFRRVDGIRRGVASPRSVKASCSTHELYR